jgi:5-methylcytosine-specific restriction endonuclease McrA
MGRLKIRTEEELKELNRIRMRRYYKNHKNERRIYQAKRMKERYNTDEKFRKKCLQKRKERYKRLGPVDYKIVREYQKKYRQKRKLWFLARETNKRSESTDKISAVDLWKVAKRQKLICPLTGDKLTTENVSVDHIIPRSKGGKNTLDNVRLVVYYVNVAKNDLTDEEFLKLCKRVVNHFSL